jgi:LuxR family transcriptional regulator, maltose regulon positive regulatory protein
VLDDVHELRGHRPLECLSYLVDHAAPPLRLVLSTRADPPVRVGRLRASGRLIEIRDATLRFELAEAAELLAACGVSLTQAELRLIHQSTEGWACGLGLVAYALERGADPRRFAIDPRQVQAVVSEYLFDEVVARQPASVQRFLMHTSVVDPLTPELAAHLTENAEAGAVLDQLQGRGVMLSRATGDATYRYHPLLTALLRGLLREQDPLLYRALHAAAAGWYERRQMAGPAEEHARAAEDWDRLGRLVLRRWLEAVLAGEEPTAGLVDGLSDEALFGTTALTIVAAAQACATRDREAYEFYGRRLAAGASPAGDGELAKWERIAGLLLTVLRGRAFGSDPDARSAAARLIADPDLCPRFRRAALLRAAELDLDSGYVINARRILANLADGELTWTSDVAMSLLALSHALEGRLRLAESVIEGVRDRTAPGQVPGPSDAVELARALVCSQRGLRSAALAIAAAPAPTIPSRLTRTVRRAVHAALAPGGALGVDASTSGHPAGSQALVALGVLEVIDPAGSRIVVGGAAEEALRRARLHHETGTHRTVLDSARPWVGNPPLTCHPRTRIELVALAAMARAALGDQEAAVELMSKALALAAEDRIWAPILAYGPELWALLQSLALAGGDHRTTALALLEELRRGQTPAFVQPLTEQEAVVLGFLPTLMSNMEIAETMHLSVNTVKTHLKAVYRKLGVERRRDAVLRARQLQLL